MVLTRRKAQLLGARITLLLLAGASHGVCWNATQACRETSRPYRVWRIDPPVPDPPGRNDCGPMYIMHSAGL